MKERVIKISIIVLAIAIITAVLWKPLVGFVTDPQSMRDRLAEYGFAGYLIFMGLVALQTIVAIIPGGPFQVAGGFAYGTVVGSLLCLIGAVAGSMVVFFLVRKFGEPFIRLFFKDEQIRPLKDFMETKKAKGMFLALFILPGSPKDLLCYIVGLSEIGALKWMLVCTLGRLPAVVLSAISGNAAQGGAYFYAIIVLAVLVVMSVAGYSIFIYIQRKQGKKKKEDKKD